MHLPIVITFIILFGLFYDVFTWLKFYWLMCYYFRYIYIYIKVNTLFFNGPYNGLTRNRIQVKILKRAASPYCPTF